MQQVTRTDNCKVATLHATTKSSINCNEHLSSAEHGITKLNGWFDQAPSQGASTAVLFQTVAHMPRCAMRCLKCSAKYASFDTATLLLGSFLHGFLCGNVRWS
jgi:hypothetical protein